MKTLEYDLGPCVRAFTTTHAVNARRTNPLPLARLTGLSPERIVIPHQVHDIRCLLVDTPFMKLPQDHRTQCLEGIDAVMTALPNTLICISTADCIPIIIYDKRHHAVAAIHAGWKGTVRRIAEHAFAQMQENFGTQGADSHAIIGPGISLESFEVGDEVYERFSDANFDMESLARRFPTRDARTPSNTKWHIDLKLCNRQQLEHIGIPACHIYVSDICTMTHPDFYSARREGIGTGRNMTCIQLKHS